MILAAFLLSLSLIVWVPESTKPISNPDNSEAEPAKNEIEGVKLLDGTGDQLIST